MKVPTVYTGAIGYRDCDALLHIVAVNHEIYEQAMAEAIEEEQYARQQDCDHEPEAECDCADPDLWEVGPFQESLLDLAREERRYGSFHLMIAGLRSSGAAYLAGV